MRKIIEQFNKDYEEVQAKFPSHRDYVASELRKFRSSAIGTMNELREKEEIVKKEAEVNYREVRGKKIEAENRLYDKLKSDIFAESSLAYRQVPFGRQVFDKLWDKAYERKHSYGMLEVLDEYDDMESLFLDCYELVIAK